MKQTEIGMIPDDWEVRKFKSLTTRITVGIANSATHAYSDKGIIMFRNQNIKANYLDSYDLIYIKEEFANKYSNKQIKENDLLIARTGYPGTTCVVPKKYSGAQTFTTLIASPKCGLDSNYCAYFFNSNIGKRLFAAAQIGGAQKNVNVNTLSNICISLPPTLSEQQKIAKALSDVDNVISTLEKLITKKKNLKQGTMQQLLTGKKRLPGFASTVVEPVETTKFKQTEIGEIPEDWEVKSFGNFVTIVRGGSPRPIQDYLTNNSDGINWIKIGDVNPEDKYIVKTEEKILPSGKARSREVHKGDFILTNSMSFGRPYILKINGCIHDGWLAIQNYTTTFDSDYLYYLLGSEKVFEQYISMAAGSSVQNLNKQKVSKLIVQIPSKPEQSAIANVLSSMDKEIEALITKLEKYRNLKTGMMQQLLTGKIRLG